jgi:hypothetical protein
MGIKQTPFQPDYCGKHDHTPVVRPGMSCPQANELKPVTRGFAGKSKRFHEVAINGAMTHIWDSGKRGLRVTAR